MELKMVLLYENVFIYKSNIKIRFPKFKYKIVEQA